MDQGRVQLPKSGVYRRSNLIEYTVIYHLLNQYMASVAQDVRIGNQEKQVKLEELGRKLGMNVMESLASTSFDKIHINQNQEVGKYTDYVRFLGKDFWQYMFGQQVSKVQMNKAGTVYEIEDRYDEQKKSNTTVIKPGFQMTRRVRVNTFKLQEEFLQQWSALVKGLVKGAMRALTVECDVEVEFCNNEPSDLKFSIAIRD